MGGRRYTVGRGRSRFPRHVASSAGCLLLVALAAAPAVADEGLPDPAGLRAKARSLLSEQGWREASIAEQGGTPPGLSYSLAWDHSLPGAGRPGALAILLGAQVEIECVRDLAVRQDRTDGRFGSPFWAEAIAAAEAHIRSGLAALAAGKQPPAASGDLAALLHWHARDAILSHLWDWASKAGVRLSGAGEEFAPSATSDGVRGYADLRAQVLRAYEEYRGPLPGIALSEGAVEYYLADGPPRFDPAPGDPVSPLRPVALLVEGIRRASLPGRPGAETAGGWSWAPALERAERMLASAVADATDDRHAPSARSDRASVLAEKVRGVFFTALWERAIEQDLLLWPLAAPPGEGRTLTTPVEATPPDGGSPFPLFVEPERTIVHSVPARYESVTEQVLISPGRWEVKDGRRVWVEPVYEVRTRTVQAQPSQTRVEVVPARLIDLTISAEFGEVRHVWFLDRFTYETRQKYRPDPPGRWDRGPDLPPTPPWVDLWVSRDALVRRREPLQQGYVVVVGTKGARGPEFVQFGSEAEARAVFSTCTRPLP